jgi:hypothetical protein
MRLVPPVRHHLQAIDAGQLLLPFQTEAGALPISLSDERADGTPVSSPRHSSRNTLEEQNPDMQERGGTPKRRVKDEKQKPPNRASVSPDAKLLVSCKVASEMLSISIRRVDYMIADGRLSTRRIANRVLIPIEEIRKFAQSDHPMRLAG